MIRRQEHHNRLWALRLLVCCYSGVIQRGRGAGSTRSVELGEVTRAVVIPRQNEGLNLRNRLVQGAEDSDRGEITVTTNFWKQLVTQNKRHNNLQYN
jgi:hypothetical protein